MWGVGLGFIVVSILIVLKSFYTHPQQFLIPGFTDVGGQELGRHYVWYDFQPMFEGKTFQTDESVPDNRILPSLPFPEFRSKGCVGLAVLRLVV